ncbi:unnamed protein product [Camellia sinensis]
MTGTSSVTRVFGAEVFVINYPGRGQSINILKELDCTYTWKIDNFSSLDGQIHYSDVFTFGNRKWNLRLYPKGDLTAKDKCLSLFLGLDDLKTFPSERKTYAKYKMHIRNQYHGEHMEIEGDILRNRDSALPRKKRVGIAFLWREKRDPIQDGIARGREREREREREKPELAVAFSFDIAFSSDLLLDLRSAPGPSICSRLRSSPHRLRHCHRSDCFTSSSISWGTSSLLSLTDLHDASKGFLVNDTLIVEAEVSGISTVKNFSV